MTFLKWVNFLPLEKYEINQESPKNLKKVNVLPDKDIDSLIKLFEMFDKDKDGLLSLEEFKAGFKSVPHNTQLF